MDTVKKNQILNEHGINHSSAYLRNCAVVCHDNPILRDCVVDGVLKSDLYFALQLKDEAMVNQLNKVERGVRFGETLPRHMTAEDYQKVVDNTTTQIDDLVDSVNVSASKPEPAPTPSQAEPASQVDNQ